VKNLALPLPDALGNDVYVIPGLILCVDNSHGTLLMPRFSFDVGQRGLVHFADISKLYRSVRDLLVHSSIWRLSSLLFWSTNWLYVVSRRVNCRYVL